MNIPPEVLAWEEGEMFKEIEQLREENDQLQHENEQLRGKLERLEKENIYNKDSLIDWLKDLNEI